MHFLLTNFSKFILTHFDAKIYWKIKKLIKKARTGKTVRKTGLWDKDMSRGLSGERPIG